MTIEGILNKLEFEYKLHLERELPASWMVRSWQAKLAAIEDIRREIKKERKLNEGAGQTDMFTVPGEEV